ncbi:unnamed protein product [Lampetra planeri]
MSSFGSSKLMKRGEESRINLLVARRRRWRRRKKRAVNARRGEHREETNTAAPTTRRRKSCGVAQRTPQVTWPRLNRVVADMDVSEEEEDTACAIEGVPGTGPLNGDVKRSLAKYFEIKRKSGGGECTVEEKDGTVVVRFNSRTVRDCVLQRNPHTIDLPGFGTTQLTLQPYCQVPPVPPPKMQAVKEHAIGGKKVQISVYSSAGIDAIIDKRRLILTGFPTTIQMEMINLYVASITDAEVCDIEYLKGGEVAVVTFINPIDWKSALRMCAKRPLVQAKITATMLEASNCLLVEASNGSLCEDLLTLYFENSAKSGGGPLTEVNLENSKTTAYLSFFEPAVAQEVVSRKHKLNEAELKVYPYYHALASTLGKQIRTAKPEPFDLVVDSEIIQFISKHSSSMDQLKYILKKANTSFSLGSNGTITLTSKLDECAVNFQSLASKWQQTAKICFLKFCEMYSKTVLPCSKAAWERVKQEVSNHDNVLVDYDSQQAHIIVSGRNQDVQDVCKHTKPIVKKVQDDLLKESQIISDRISLESPDKYNLIQMLEIEADLRAKFKESELTFDEKSYSLTVKGMPQDCQKIKDEISKHLKGISSKEVKMSSNIVMFLKMLGRDILNTNLFSNRIHAKIQLKNNNSISITAFANQLGKAESFIEETFTEESFPIPEESMHAMRGREWTDLLSNLEENKVDSILQVFINKSLDDAGLCTKVNVAGFGNAVYQTCQELDDFCEKHLRITKQIPIKSKNILKYLQEYEKIFEDQTLLNKNVKTLSESLLEVSGHPDDVDKIKNLFEKKSSEIVLKSVKCNKPGAAKYMRENESVIKSIAEGNQKCMVLIDVIGAAASRQVGMQLKCQEVLSANLTISIYKGDILKSQADIIINAADTKMCFKSGFGKVLSEAAGPDTSRSCAQYIRDNGEPQPGEAVISVPGKLPCKSVAHVICQLFEKCNGNVDMSKVIQLKQGLKKALKLVGTRGHQSAAMPGLVFQNSGYPLEVCAKALIDAVAEFGQVNDPGNCLTDVFFIDLNDNVVHALVNALLSNVGKAPKATPQTGLTFSLPAFVKIQSSTAAPTSPTCMITKEGLNISLVIGSIENENSDVIINTTSANMKMDSGGVSSAIFRKAGPTLQTLVDTEIQGQSIGSGKIVKTDVTGLNLQCKALYHTTLGSWDNGNHLRKCMKRSLEMAHRDGVSSISFPALGTGNLKYSPLMVSSFMFEEVINFSQNHQGTTLKDIRFVIFSKDQLVISENNLWFCNLLCAGKTSIPPTLNITSKAVQRAIGNISVEVVDGDITKEKVDAIVNSTNTTLDLDSGVSGAILKAAGQVVVDECTTLGPQPGDGVVVTSGGALSCKHIVHMVGQTNPASIKSSVLKVLRECEMKKVTSVSFPATGTGAGSVPAAVVADAMMEGIEEHIRVHTLTSPLKHIRFVIFQPEMLKDFQQALINTSQMTELPADWAPMKGTEFLKVTLSVQSPEYQQVQANFMKSVKHLKIIKIERIQNMSLYHTYQVMKKSIESRNDGQMICEKLLFHGTRSDSIDNITHHGFNRSYAGKNATVLGVGTYFALNAWYSASDTYSKPDANGTKYMFQARVLTGSYCKGDSSMKEPPLKSPFSKTVRYDSVVDNSFSPSMFVVFYDNQAYPEYLITFSK